jgi:hypothetical protein
MASSSIRIEPSTLCSASTACGASLSMLIGACLGASWAGDDGHGGTNLLLRGERPIRGEYDARPVRMDEDRRAPGAASWWRTSRVAFNPLINESCPQPTAKPVDNRPPPP